MDLTQKIISLTKQKGFIFPSSEIYGGIQGFYDYGPLGVQLKNNIKNAWWRAMVQERDDIGKSVQLIGSARISGDDNWTDMVLEAETAALDTVSLSDQNMTEDKGKVRNGNDQ